MGIKFLVNIVFICVLHTQCNNCQQNTTQITHFSENSTDQELISNSSYETLVCIGSIFKWNLKLPLEGYMKDDGKFCVRELQEDTLVNSTKRPNEFIDLVNGGLLYDKNHYIHINGRYRSGDPLFTLIEESDTTQLFGVPQMTSSCLPSPVAYLHDINHTCPYVNTPQNQLNFKTCKLNAYPLLLPRYYFNLIFLEGNILWSRNASATKFGVVKYPVTCTASRPKQDSNTTRNEVNAGGVNSSSTCDVLPHYVNGVCLDVVMKAVYMFQYGSDGLKGIQINLTLGDINNQTTLPLFQTHVVVYRKLNESWSGNVRSGNPGYDPGSRVLMSYGHNNICDPHDPMNQLMILPPSPSSANYIGICDTTFTRQPIKFKVNMISGYLLSYNLSEGSVESCVQMQKCVMNLLLGHYPPPQYVSSSGNTMRSFCNASHWVPIVFDNLPSVQNKTDSMCRNMVTGLDVLITYAGVGSMRNPFSYIIGVNVRYVLKNVSINNHQCSGSYCAMKDHITIPLTSSVNFYNVA